MTETVRVPAIRFKGFTDAWEQRKLGEVTQYATSSLKIADCTDEGEFDLYDANSVIGKTNFNVQTEDYITIIKDGSGVGTVRLLPKNTSFIGTMGAILAKNSEIEFIYALLQRFDFSQHINGATIPHVYYSEYKQDIIYAPIRNEQRIIGKIFKQLDNLITLHQRKCDKLKNIKAALLEKMFPAEGKNTPAIRFKGFTDAWEQRKFDYFFTERTDRSGDGELISVTINSGIKKFAELNRFDSKPEDMSNYKVVCEGDIAYNSMRMWQGASGYSPYNGILSPAYTVIVPKNGVSSKFFAYVLKRPKMIHLFEINSQGLTKDTWNLKFPAFSQIEATAPMSFDEQDQISTFLEQLDNLITLHQRKVEKLKNIKSALLEKMFV